MKVKSYAKINLALDVLKKSGRYHKIRTIFQQIGLFDELTFKKIPGKKIVIACDVAAVPTGAKNTVRIAAEILKKYAAGQATSRQSTAQKSMLKNICGVHVRIRKNIPVSAGLGGGSSNGAAALIALNRMWRLKIPMKTSRTLAAKIGMDAPFFIRGGTALGTHYGEKITTLPPVRPLPLLVAMAGKKTATADVYRRLDLKKTGKKTALTSAIVSALRSKKRIGFRGLVHNDFETILGRKELAKTRALFDMLLNTAALTVGLCGSGPAVYAMYARKKDRDAALDMLKRRAIFARKAD